MKYLSLIVLFITSLTMALTGCVSTIDKRGEDFVYKPTLVIGQTTKRQVLEVYGQPTSSDIRGKYEILNYYYEKKSLKHGRTIGTGLLAAVPVIGMATLAMDHGVQDSEIANEFKTMVVFAELSSGIVRDFYYHDSDQKGHDESETLLIKAHGFLREGKNEEAIQILEQAVRLNPANHRALNSLAWTMIDLNIDLDKGVAHAERAVEVFPDSPYNNGTLGCGCYKRGDMERAEKYLSAAVKLFPVYAPQDSKALSHDKAILSALQEKKKQGKMTE